MIQIHGLTFAYPNGTVIFEGFSWMVERGEAWAVIGPSGCGKTTLLYLLAGLRQPTARLPVLAAGSARAGRRVSISSPKSAGRVLIDGDSLTRPRPRTGLILQDYGLLPWATVWDNAALGLQIRAFYGPDGVHTPTDEKLDDKRARVNGWLKRLGIHHVAKQYPHQISGGQRQRTAIARTLVLRPDLLLMDEPFGALDALTREDLQNLTLELRAEQHLTTVIVTHNIEEAVFMGERILVLGQPPNRETVVVQNPQAGGVDYRKQDAFFARCNELRELMGEDANEVA